MRAGVWWAAALLTTRAWATPAEIGTWRTQDGSSVIQIIPCGPGLCGRIVGVSLDHETDPPPRDMWGNLQCGETIIRMNRLGADGRWHGTILDPRSGRNWSAQVWRAGGTLLLRGYLGLPLFGATQAWTPYGGALTPDCAYRR